ncbi:ankyrin repeat-containing domain protein, partial [Baffinella frigidus]
LHGAVERNDCKMVEDLLRRQADPALLDSQNYTPFHIAAICGSCEAASLLLSTKGGRQLIEASSTRYGETALYLAAMNGNVGMMELLVQYGTRIYTRMKQNRKTVRKKEVLHAAVLFAGSLNGTKKPMEYILQHKVGTIHMDIVDDMGFAPIHLAILGGKNDVLDLLLEHGTSVD